jgi:two-component system phosphate regulon response regulator PhoB
MASILIVEDEPDAADLLALNLRAAGHSVTIAEDGSKGLTVARTTRPDLIVLDNMLPLMSGVEVCKALRATPATADVPIIMLTARAAESDRVRGLECGADDYVTKPYSVKELLLRVQNHLRRSKPQVGTDQRLVAGPLSIDLVAQTVMVNGEEVRLTSTECKLLSTLARSGGQAVSRQQLLTDVWQYVDGSDTRTVDSHVRRLRAKLGPLAECVETVQGVGYRLST